MTVYLDIIFLENICMNYIILLATGLIVKVKIKHIKIFLSSIIGGAYVVCSYITKFEVYSNTILKILLSIAMIYLAFSPKNIKGILKQITIFYLTSFAFGGCAFALLYFVKPQNILVKNGVFIGTYPIKIAILGGILGFFIINIAFKLIKGRKNRNALFCDILIFLDEKNIKLHALVDTGNLLKEPITGSSVVIVEKEKLYNLIEDDILNNIENIINVNERIDEKYISKLRLIPFSSLGMPNGMLIGMKADRVRVYFDDEEHDFDNVIIGIYEKKLTKNNSYNALVGLNLLELDSN